MIKINNAQLADGSLVDVEISNGLTAPTELIFFVDQGWLQIK
jgi:hypothetical protein